LGGMVTTEIRPRHDGSVAGLLLIALADDERGRFRTAATVTLTRGFLLFSRRFQLLASGSCFLDIPLPLSPLFVGGLLLATLFGIWHSC
ncbi:MAG: hypothetical protein ACI8U4_000416, partial [Natronomonas sp.]